MFLTFSFRLTSWGKYQLVVYFITRNFLNPLREIYLKHTKITLNFDGEKTFDFYRIIYFSLKKN